MSRRPIPATIQLQPTGNTLSRSAGTDTTSSSTTCPPHSDFAVAGAGAATGTGSLIHSGSTQFEFSCRPGVPRASHGYRKITVVSGTGDDTVASSAHSGHAGVDLLDIPWSSYRVAFVDDEAANVRLGVRMLTGIGIAAANIIVLRDGTCACQCRSP